MKGSLKLVISQLATLSEEIEVKQKQLRRRIKSAAEIYEVEVVTIQSLIERASK